MLNKHRADKERPAPRIVDRKAPIWLDAEFITPQGTADDLERRDSIVKAVEDLLLVLAAIAVGFALAGVAIALIAGGGA